MELIIQNSSGSSMIEFHSLSMNLLNAPDPLYKEKQLLRTARKDIQIIGNKNSRGNNPMIKTTAAGITAVEETMTNILL